MVPKTIGVNRPAYVDHPGIPCYHAREWDADALGPMSESDSEEEEEEAKEEVEQARPKMVESQAEPEAEVPPPNCKRSSWFWIPLALVLLAAVLATALHCNLEPKKAQIVIVQKALGSVLGKGSDLWTHVDRMAEEEVELRAQLDARQAELANMTAQLVEESSRLAELETLTNGAYIQDDAVVASSPGRPLSRILVEAAANARSSAPTPSTASDPPSLFDAVMVQINTAQVHVRPMGVAQSTASIASDFAISMHPYADTGSSQMEMEQPAGADSVLDRAPADLPRLPGLTCSPPSTLTLLLPISNRICTHRTVPNQYSGTEVRQHTSAIVLQPLWSCSGSSHKLPGVSQLFYSVNSSLLDTVPPQTLSEQLQVAFAASRIPALNPAVRQYDNSQQHYDNMTMCQPRHLSSSQLIIHEASGTKAGSDVMNSSPSPIEVSGTGLDGITKEPSDSIQMEAMRKIKVKAQLKSACRWCGMLVALVAGLTCLLYQASKFGKAFLLPWSMPAALNALRPGEEPGPPPSHIISTPRRTAGRLLIVSPAGSSTPSGKHAMSTTVGGGSGLAALSCLARPNSVHAADHRHSPRWNPWAPSLGCLLSDRFSNAKINTKIETHFNASGQDDTDFIRSTRRAHNNATSDETAASATPTKQRPASLDGLRAPPAPHPSLDWAPSPARPNLDGPFSVVRTRSTTHMPSLTAATNAINPAFSRATSAGLGGTTSFRNSVPTSTSPYRATSSMALLNLQAVGRLETPGALVRPMLAPTFRNPSVTGGGGEDDLEVQAPGLDVLLEGSGSIAFNLQPPRLSTSTTTDTGMATGCSGCSGTSSILMTTAGSSRVAAHLTSQFIVCPSGTSVVAGATSLSSRSSNGRMASSGVPSPRVRGRRASLQQEVLDLKQQVSSLAYVTSKLRRDVKLCADLKMSIKGVQAKRDEAVRELGVMQRGRQQQQQQLAGMQQRVSQLEAAIEGAQGEQQRLTQALEEAQAGRRDEQDRAEKVSGSCSELAASLLVERQRLVVAQAELTGAQVDITETATRNAQLEAQLETGRAAVASAQQEMHGLQSRIEGLENELGTSRAAKAAAEHNVNALTEKTINLETENEGLMGMVEAANLQQREDAAALKAHLVALACNAAQMAAKESLVARLQGELEASRRREAEARRELAVTSDEIQALGRNSDHQAQQVQQQATALRAADEKLAGLEAQIAAVQKAFESVESENSDLRILVDRKVAEEGALRAQLAAREAELRETIAQLEEKDALLADSATQLAGKVTQLREKDTELAMKAAQLAEKDTQLAEGSTRLAERRTQQAETEQRLAELQARVTELEERVAELEGTVAVKEAELERLRGAHVALVEEVGALQVQKDELKEHNGEVLVALQGELAAKVQDLQQAGARLANAEALHAEEVARFQGEVRRLQAARDGVQRQQQRADAGYLGMVPVALHFRSRAVPDISGGC